MIIILSDIDGYYNDNPKTNPNAILQKMVSSINKEELEAKHNGSNTK